MGSGPIRERSTSDLVILFLAGCVGFCLVAGVIGLFALKIIRPEEEITGNLRVLADVLTVIVGAVVGYVGGRAAARPETPNGPHSEE